MGKIVTLGEVVADVYEEHTPSEVELQFTVRPGGDDAPVVRGYSRSSSVICGDQAPLCARRPSRQRVEVDVVQGGDQHIRLERRPGAPRHARARGRGPPFAGLGRLDAGHRVLDDEALRRRHAQLLGPREEDLRMRLPCAKSRPEMSASKNSRRVSPGVTCSDSRPFSSAKVSRRIWRRKRPHSWRRRPRRHGSRRLLPR